MSHHQPAWFKSAVLYQIYPRSFYDSNNDGIGDLPGITQKLDYLAGKHDSLGVNAIWLSPFYPSPLADFGYDVSDHCAVDPMYGTLKDFKDLLKAAHEREIKVIVDFIPNHTSNQHAWFQESRSSKDNPKRNWYTWQDAKPDGSPPNNWLSNFGGSAWTLDKKTGQYYLHSFLPEQPDLNWDNPEVRAAMKDVLRFWLDLGVDGFRVDAVYWLSKDPELRKDPANLSTPEPNDIRPRYSKAGPHLYKYLQEIAGVLKAYPDRFMITEAYPEKWRNIVSYIKFYKNVAPSVSAPFNFEGIDLPWEAKAFQSFIDRFQAKLHTTYVPVYNLGNHDKPRLATRVGPVAARTAAMLLLTLPGMPIMYYGDEIGMTNALIMPSEVKDPAEKNQPGLGYGRDPERTPLQWDATAHAGFSKHKTWLPIPENYRYINIDSEATEPYSMLSLYKQLLSLRNGLATLKYGRYHPLMLHEDVLAYQRRHGKERLTVLLNFSDAPIALTSRSIRGKLLLSTHLDIAAGSPVVAELTLRPHEGVVIQNA